MPSLRDCGATPRPAARERESDRARYPDPAFNAWLDQTVTENAEFTVWNMLDDTGSAWAGWDARGNYS